jgi:hypothetical protein
MSVYHAVQAAMEQNGSAESWIRQNTEIALEAFCQDYGRPGQELGFG